MLVKVKLLLLAHVAQSLSQDGLESNGLTLGDGLAWVENVVGSFLKQLKGTLLKLLWGDHGGDQLWAKWGLLKAWKLVTEGEGDYKKAKAQNYTKKLQLPHFQLVFKHKNRFILGP